MLHGSKGQVKLLAQAWTCFLAVQDYLLMDFLFVAGGHALVSKSDNLYPRKEFDLDPESGYSSAPRL